MNKKYFIFTTLIIALLIFSILPIANYIADPSRILHRDYKTRYLKFHPHKLFLKVAHLVDNKEKYDTLVYGSSRGGFVDVSRISKDAYNMSHGFGTVTNYLHSLKSLLANGVKVKNVWIGVNDFVIWKDHTNDLPRLINKNNFIGNFEIYSHWLFNLLPASIGVLKEDLPLIETEEVTNPHARIIRAREQEKIVRMMKRNIHAATLGYTGIFRIDQAVQEIKEIKDLCDQNDINLTVFMYPIFHKTYLKYNQYKIEEFKRKLVSVVDFYDFYDLGELSINQKNWFEGSHFVPSVADYMIKSIQENNFLVTKDTIEDRIKETRGLIKNMSILPLGDFQRYSPNINLDVFKIIFDINDNKYTYYKNDHFILKKNKNTLDIVVNNSDPMFILDNTKTKLKRAILTFNIESEQETYMKIYLKNDDQLKYNEKNIHKAHINKGLNEFRIVMSSKYINNQIRIDFANDQGKYTIKKFIIRELD